MADGRIRAIRPAEQEAGTGLLAMPAMVNAHDHGYGLRPLAQGIADDALECWIACLHGRISVDPWLEAVVAFGRMARSGIGSTVHCHNSLRANRLLDEVEGVSRAAADIGIRVAFVCPILDRNPWIYGDQQDFLPHVGQTDRAFVESAVSDQGPKFHLVDQVEEIAKAYENGRFNVQYGPVGPQWCHNRTLERIAESSARTGRRIHMHFLESPRQRQWLDAAYPQGIVQHLDDIGLLSPRLGVAHGVQLREAETALLAERGVSVAVNTSSNLRLRSGIAPVARFIRQGLCFGFGLDGAAHDDDQDYLRDLRLVQRLHAGTGLEHALPPSRLFRAAHKDGFRFIDGSDDYGDLEAGSRADLLSLEFDAMAADAVSDCEDVEELLLARMRAEHVRGLYVAGKAVVKRGSVTGLDLAFAERELIGRARRKAPDLAFEMARRRRLREAVRSYYSGS